MFSSGNSSLTIEELTKNISEGDIVYKYLGVDYIPCVINSPLRVDNKPSFGLYSRDGKRIFYTDFATGDSGSIYKLLSTMWNLSIDKTLNKINNDFNNIDSTLINCKNNKTLSANRNIIHKKEPFHLEVKLREWKDYDIQYWESYGIPIDWVKYADVYPISHSFITKKNKRLTFKADKYAYAFLERKEGNLTIKVYQPYNTKGFKWSNSHNSSVISLWTKVPPSGEQICICSSLKDALCLWSNIGIPALAIQGEGYSMSTTAIDNLKKRYKHIYILLDRDEVGLKDGVKLANSTGFTNLVLPDINGAKDISDLYLTLKNKQRFVETLKPLFNITTNN